MGGGLITLDVIHRAIEVGATGILGGGIRDGDLRNLLGHDLGVAITGAESIGLTVILTEGFGEIAMARKTFDILKENNGKEASISGATQIRAGVLRPEIIIPNPAAKPTPQSAEIQIGLSIGAQVRAIRTPFFGRIGTVTALPPKLQSLESETQVRVLEIEFEDGVRAIVPRANVERIEE